MQHVQAEGGGRRGCSKSSAGTSGEYEYERLRRLRLEAQALEILLGGDKGVSGYNTTSSSEIDNAVITWRNGQRLLLEELEVLAPHLTCAGGQRGRELLQNVRITTTPLSHVIALQSRADTLEESPGLLI